MRHRAGVQRKQAEKRAPDGEPLLDAIARLGRQILKAEHVYICGNGGSAANALHWANDLFACGVRAHALTGDVSTLTAIGNDYDFNEIFARQVMVFGRKGDMLIVLSGSGRSQNIWRALHEARKLKMATASIFGAYNEDFYKWADTSIRVGDSMEKAENAQLYVLHELKRWLKNARQLTHG